MKIAVVDPGLGDLPGRSRAVAEELSLDLQGRDEVELTIFGGLSSAHAARSQGASDVEPRLRVDARWWPGRFGLGGADGLRKILGVIADDLLGCGLDGFDFVLMPNASPLWVTAFALIADRLTRARVALELSQERFPFISGTPDWDLLQLAYREAIERLAARGNACLYSCDGGASLGSRTIEVTTLLPPLAASTLAGIEATSLRLKRTSDRWRIGYFGSPSTAGAMPALHRIVRQALPPHVELRIALPPGNDELLQIFGRAGPAVTTTVVESDRGACFAALQTIDAVLAVQDPIDRAAGIPDVMLDALTVGKPVVISEGQLDAARLLDDVAPGAFVSAPCGEEGLRAVFALEARAWDRVQMAAEASAPVVRALRGMPRFLTAVGLGQLHDDDSLVEAIEPGSALSVVD